MQQGIKQILFPKQQRRHLPFILFFFEVAAGSRLFPPEFCSVKLSLILVQATKNGAEYICGRVTGFRQTEDNRAGILEPVCSTVFLRVNPSGRKKIFSPPSSVTESRHHRLTRGRSYLLLLGSVADPERFDADPDPTFYVDPDPVLDQPKF